MLKCLRHLSYAKLFFHIFLSVSLRDEHYSAYLAGNITEKKIGHKYVLHIFSTVAILLSTTYLSLCRARRGPNIEKNLQGAFYSN